MKFKSFLLTLLVASLKFILFPLLFIYLNSLFNLPVFSNIALKIIGILLIVAGIAIFSYCFGLFKIFGKGTPVPIEPPKELVIQGIYKYTRNPMYMVYMLILYGEFFILGELLLLLYAIIFMLVVHLLVVFWEEKTLQKRFGESYKNYCKKVPRWL